MAKSKSDISNSAIRILLQKVGRFYDESRGFEPFGPKVGQKEELLRFFNFECCFCGEELDIKTLSQDHLIPMNKTSLGLHAWGNVVPCCKSCNNVKQKTSWLNFLTDKAGKHAKDREKRIREFISAKNYDPTLNLHSIADNLYQDVGEVAMTLINLRYKQAQESISKLVE